MSDMVPEVLNAALDSLFTPKEPGEQEWQRQPWCQVPGHEAADGWWWRCPYRHDSRTAALWPVRLIA
jgi:hypothetical protein